jgi:hypothetical protein
VEAAAEAEEPEAGRLAAAEAVAAIREAVREEAVTGPEAAAGSEGEARAASPLGAAAV